MQARQTLSAGVREGMLKPVTDGVLTSVFLSSRAWV